MYRDDSEALQQRAEAATREAERLKRENEAMRAAVGRAHAGAPPMMAGLPPNAAYTLVDLRMLPLEERARLAMHSVRPFPVWAVAILNLVTFGIFPLIHFGIQHDRLPRASSNDPSAGKAIGFQFIPYFNLYWIFFSALRLCDRLTLQLRLRGLRDEAPKGLVLAACILTVIPYINILIGIPIMWTIAVCFLQATVNKVAKLNPMEWDASTIGGASAAAPVASPYAPSPYAPSPYAPSPYPPSPYAASPYAAPAYAAPTPEQLAIQARAKKLVNYSHLLGWGGLGLLVIGTPCVFAFAGVTAGEVAAALFAACLIVGAIVGQIGRGMQGRAI